ncbi:restriction endonuclease subunit S [uncultured Tateyamaria sp.]|uniref:restriction endonuclease subunit S n=1 Tax=uncultured Tateyamaria sp. TaxID=455651 RepID=UPI0026372E7C|nr:restriction endonuclease subunit S [uncultured Tateyamaria sp.]
MTDVNQLITDHLDIWVAATEKKSSAGRGNGGATSLYGIQRLRELILELAVRGKLVPQDQDEEPADGLLDRLHFQQSQMFAKGFIKKPKPLAKITKTEIPFELPRGWTWCRVSQLGHDWGQKVPKGQFTYIDVGSINKELGLVSEPTVLEASKAPSRARKLVRNGTVVYSTVRPYLLNIAVITETFEPEPIASTAFAIVHPFDGISASYLYRYFRSPTFISYVEGCQTGIAYPAINDKQFFSGLVPLPPTEEQLRIVAKVDELMALCDALEHQAEDSLKAHQTLVETCLATLTNSQSHEELTQNWTRIEAHFDTLFTTEDSLSSLWKIILKLAIRGSLVPQNETEGSASQLLRSIAAKKEVLISNGRLRKSKALKVINEDEAPFTLPNGWAWSRLNDFIDVRDGTHDSPKDANGTNTFPLVTSKNFKNGDIDFDSARRISAADHFEISKRSRVEQDDILFSMIGGNLGNQVMVRTDEVFSVKNVALFKYYDKTQSIPEFVKLYMENLAVDLQSQASGGAQPFVSLGFLRNLMIGVPTIEEQERIVAKARELERLIELTRGRISISTASSVELADTLTSKIH